MILWPIWGTCCSSAGEVEEIRGHAREHETLAEVLVSRDDWPWWRGPHRDGIAAAAPLPLAWGDPRHQLWKVTVPGRGHAAPIVWGHQVFLATADEDQERYLVLAFDRSTGQPLWQTELHRGGFMKKIHRHNSHASATGACDGERLFAAFIHQSALWLSAVDLDGRLLWQTNTGPYDAIYGFGSALAIHGSLVICCADNDQTGAFLVAVHRKTGKIVWRVTRPDVDTYATPIVVRLAGRDQLLVGGGGWLCSYDPLNGELLWKCTGPTTETTANTVAFSADHVFVSGGYPKPYTMMSVAADGRGDVTSTHRQWVRTKGMPYVPSPVYHEGLLYVADDWGIATCMAADSGETIWQKRLGGDITSSPVLCGERLFVINEEGVVYVLATGRKFQLLGKSSLEESVMATPAICGGRAYVRTATQLICIGE